jgi:hypothetical protein
MRNILLAGLLVLAAAPRAWATAWDGSTFTGGDLTLANGDTQKGTFLNVSSVTLPVGATIFVTPGDSLVIYASTVGIYGTLDGSGRGQPGGGGGAASGGGSDGFAPSGTSGSGGGGSVSNGGGGGGGAGAGGVGARGGTGGVPVGAGSAAGTAYGAAVSAPLSANDAWQGSGGGGGGGNNTLGGGGGSAGGASIYIEASSMTVTGTISVNGSTATPVTDGAVGVHPAGGGGGAGGSVVLRVAGGLSLASTARIRANGGTGGNVDTFAGGTLEPGGGGGGGRLRIFSTTPNYAGVVFSTAAGAAGAKTTGFAGSVEAVNPPAAGTEGTASFGTVAAAPTNFQAQGIYVSSISYVWTATAGFGDGANPQYRLFPSTATAPLANPDGTSAFNVAASTLTGLTPNTTYFRFVTAYTDWGDSAPSNSASTHTLANVPGVAAASFSSMADTSLTANWTANTPANPSYTTYEVGRALDAGFTLGAASGFVVALSSAPTDLSPNTTYFFRVRAVNLRGVQTAFASTLSTSTLATAPSNAAFGTVFVTSGSFAWNGGNNPVGTRYEAQISTDNFFTLAAASSTLSTSATFFTLTPGTQYFFRAFSLNHNSVPSAFSAVISTRSGNLSDTTQPTSPGIPSADRQFSYDGAATYDWTAAVSGVGILDYHLIIGSTPGGNDFVDVATTTTRYIAAGMLTGRSYYARVRGRSNAGVYSEFSGISPGLPVFITNQSSALTKAINWPNPFNPNNGPTQIGLFMEEPGEVELKIFTLAGKQVHSRVFPMGAGGNQIITWDGKNDGGGKAAPGGYIALLIKKYAGRTQTQKLKIALLY